MELDQIELGRIGSMRRIIGRCKNSDDCSILLKGWRKDVLLPELLKNMPEAILLDVNNVSADKKQISKLSLKNIWLGFWLGPIIGLYSMAVEDKKYVYVMKGKGGSVILKFTSSQNI